MALQVLVVDDDPDIRRIVAQLLQVRFRALVAQAVDGHTAWAAIDTKVPDLLILDVSMPGMDGITFLEKLRADPERAAIRVVALSATDERDTIVKMVELGVLDYILKPINLASASRRIARALELSTTRPPAR